MNSKPLSLLCLECVLQHMEANLRFRLSRHCPSIRGLEKGVPLHIQFLNLDEYQFTVNDTNYHLSIYQDYSGCKTIPWNVEMDNAYGGIQEDLDIYGGRIKRETLELEPGDIVLKSRFDRDADDDDGKEDDGDKEEALKRSLEELEQKLARRKQDGIYIEHSIENAQYIVDQLEPNCSQDGSNHNEVVEDSLFSQDNTDSEKTVPDSVHFTEQIEEDEVVQDSYGMEDDGSDESFVQDSLFEDVTQEAESNNLKKAENDEDSLFKDLESQNSETALSPLFSDSEPMTLVDRDIMSEMKDDQLLQKIESVKHQLLLYQLKRENSTPPWKHFPQLTVSNFDDVVDVLRGNYNKKLAEVMKMIFDSMFGGRKSPIFIHRLYLPDSIQNNKVLRLPEDLKLKISHLHCQMGIDMILNSIEPIIDVASLPLKQVESPDFSLHPMVTSAESLLISCIAHNGVTTEYFLNLQSKEFCLKYWVENFHASDCVPIIQNWLETGKEVGTCFQFAMERVEMEVLMGIKSRFNEEKIGDRSIEIPMFVSKLLVSYEDGYADGYHDIMFKMEVVPN